MGAFVFLNAALSVHMVSVLALLASIICLEILAFESPNKCTCLYQGICNAVIVLAKLFTLVPNLWTAAFIVSSAVSAPVVSIVKTD